MEIYFDQEAIRFDEVYDRYRKDEFYSPFRSTIPLLDLIKNGKEMLRELIHELGVKEEHTYHLEYRVKPSAVRGTPSHTDLLVQGKDHVLGIEAKWTEKRYERVERWVKKGKNPNNRKVVLQGWVNIFKEFLNNPLSIEGMNNQVYQMVHRAASVCSCTTNPILAYMQFTEALQLKKDSYIYQDLSSLWSVLGHPESFPFYFVQVLIEPNQAFREIEHLEKRSAETGRKVTEALRGYEPLFTYKGKEIVKIREA